jgi:hypothetical protein
MKKSEKEILHQREYYRHYVKDLFYGNCPESFAFVGLKNYDLVLERMFYSSGDLRIFEKNLDNEIWDSENLSYCIKYHISNGNELKLLLNEVPENSKIYEFWENHMIFNRGKIKIKTVNDFDLIKKYINPEKYFLVGDNNKVSFWNNSNKKNFVYYSFRDEKNSRKFIEGFDKLFEISKSII